MSQTNIADPKTILQQIANTNLPAIDASALPDNKDGLGDLLTEVYDRNGVTPMLVSTHTGEVVAIFQLLVHNFAKRSPVPFVSCIAPYNKAGIYQMTLVDNEVNPNERFDITDLPEEFTIPGGLATDRIEIQSAILLPHTLTHLLADAAHAERINPLTLATQIDQLSEGSKPDGWEAMIHFLLQCHLGMKAQKSLALSDPTSKGALTQQKLKDTLRGLSSPSPQADGPANLTEADSPAAADDSSNTMDDSSIEEVAANEEPSLSKEDQRLLMFLEARERSRESSSLEKLSSILAEDRQESKKDGFMKHFPDHAKDTLINARAGPDFPAPNKLAPMVTNLLTKCNSEQMALRQLQADIRKLQKSSVFDCHLDKTTINSLFRKGEVATEVPVISFPKAVGINFPIFGTSGVATQAIKSEGDFPFTISEAKSITELIESARNLRLFMEWIAGPSNISFAMIGLDNLITFLESNKGKIKRIAEQVPGVYAELQIQCSNVWSSWFNELCFEAPVGSPDFNEVLKPIRNNSAPPKTLTAAPLEPGPKRQKSNASNPIPRQSALDQRFPTKRKNVNRQPQLQIQGDNAEAKGANFGSKFGKGKVDSLRLPQINGKSICLKYHLLHHCNCRDTEWRHHGRLPVDTINQLIARSDADNLLISKVQ